MVADCFQSRAYCCAKICLAIRQRFINSERGITAQRIAVVCSDWLTYFCLLIQDQILVVHCNCFCAVTGPRNRALRAMKLRTMSEPELRHIPFSARTTQSVRVL